MHVQERERGRHREREKGKERETERERERERERDAHGDRDTERRRREQERERVRDQTDRWKEWHRQTDRKSGTAGQCHRQSGSDRTNGTDIQSDTDRLTDR